MSELATIQRQLSFFQEKYQYDVSYLEALLGASKEAFDSFWGNSGMSQFRSSLPVNAHYTAKIAALQGEDCGACTQLNVRMALEAGADKEVLRTLLERPEELPQELRDIRDHALSITSSQAPDHDRIGRLREAYGAEGLAEIAIAVTGSRLWPSMKRALGFDGVCQKVTVDVD